MSTVDFTQAVLGYSRGNPIWRLVGAEDVSGGQSAPVALPSTTPDLGQSAGSGSQDPSGQSAGMVPQADFDRIQNQLRAADQKRAEAEQARKALEDKEKNELTLVQEKSQELEQSVQTLTSELQRARIENAFLKDTTYRWQDPSVVLKLLSDDESISIDDSGKVVGVESAIKNLASKSPYLVKADDPKPPANPSGDPSNGGRKDQKDLDAEALRRKYPALKR